MNDTTPIQSALANATVHKETNTQHLIADLEGPSFISRTVAHRRDAVEPDGIRRFRL
jgi:hypothetical protein